MITNSLAEMPISKLKRAIEIREQIDSLTRELDGLMGTHQFIPVHGNNSRLRGAQLHWPTQNGNNGHGTNGHSGKARLSAEGRAKVSAAVKARWARYRAAKARAARAK